MNEYDTEEQEIIAAFEAGRLKSQQPGLEILARHRAYARSIVSKDQRELREHYDFDYSRAKPNRFAAQIQQDDLMIVLDPDVASVLPTARQRDVACNISTPTA